MTNQGGNRGAGQAAAQEGSALQGVPRRAQGRPASGRAGVVDVGAGPDHNGHRLVRDGGGQGERAVRGALVRAPGIHFNRKRCSCSFGLKNCEILTSDSTVFYMS